MSPQQMRRVALVCVCLAVGGAGIAFGIASMRGPSLPDDLLLVDVSNGQLFRYRATRTAAIFPEVNPDTQRETLLPVEELRDGECVLRRRALDYLETIQDKSAVLDAAAGIVKLAGGEVSVIQRK